MAKKKKPQQEIVPIADLSLDLKNYRTRAQTTERSAVEAMIATSPDRFWGLADSVISDGYLPTEQLIVTRGTGNRLLVREGNRRVAVLKLLHGLLPKAVLHLAPKDIVTRAALLDVAWKSENRAVPCLVYDEKAGAAAVDRIVQRTHGKGDRASRDQWNAVARARHNREVNGAREPGLDVLEKYLQRTTDINAEDKAKWSGDYKLSALDEALQKIAPCLGQKSASALADAYPLVPQREAVDEVVYALGTGGIGFHEIRAADFLAIRGFQLPATSPAKAGPSVGTSPKNSVAAGGKSTAQKPTKQKAYPPSSPEHVRRLLRNFAPHAEHAKLVALKDEAARLELQKTPLAFCFLLRSMFEIAAADYCRRHKADGLSTTKPDGKNRNLVDILKQVAHHLVEKSGNDPEIKKQLTGTHVEITKGVGVLSVTSLNQLVHNKDFTVSGTDVATSFHNSFPLLEKMSA